MLTTPLIGQASPAARALGPADRIELALAHVVNSARRASRTPSAASLSSLVEDVQDFIRTRPCELPQEWLRPSEGYRRMQLWRDPQLGCQILAMVWPPGARTPIHDHGGAWGIEAVWSGELQVTEFAVSQATRSAVRLRLAAQRSYQAGELLSFMPPADIHLCRNPSALASTVSIHVYASTQAKMTTFVAADDDWYTLSQQPLRVENG